jgi:hypothetical protein
LNATKEELEIEKIKKASRELEDKSDSEDSVDLNRKGFGITNKIEDQEETKQHEEQTQEDSQEEEVKDDVFAFSDEDEEDEWEPEQVDSDEERNMEKEDIWQKFLGEGDIPTMETGNETNRLAVMNFDWQLIDV